MNERHEPGRAAYEARFAHARPRDVEPWDSLTPEVRAIWVRVERASQAQEHSGFSGCGVYMVCGSKSDIDVVQRWCHEASTIPALRDRIRSAEARAARLRIAFHDAIRRPLGVTPDSGAEFYDPRMADEAEERRRLARPVGRHVYQPHKLYPHCAQCGYPEREALMHLPAAPSGSEQKGGDSAA